MSWFFYVYDADRMRVASGQCPTREQAQAEGLHYLRQYMQDGLHRLVIRKAPTRAPRAPSKE